ncbi:Gfo/Idh/MocA family oxidoreductase [Planosporangium thailandense]|uniref:Gfo/Idh/MocA family oxidoreductase n=1 Tax=Planosporangium thailandense TaxID=765197 RepID=A0ABX0XRC6_9ACTN|nr:Gfo/Idh/MocA family oxidoreductase [Planosporangium thailandense]NJC68343.1 Gfo/Idh/MocA family oxidoreductase [Planosporangium thailandense]
MSAARPKVVLVGTGSMGSLHARVLFQSERCDLIRVVDPNREAGTGIANRYGAKWTPELGDLSDADAVVLAAPTEHHHKIAHDILAADKPLLIEKPVCGSLAESEEIVELSEKRGLPLVCGLLERFNPAVMTAMALVDHPVHVTAARHSPYVPRIRTGVAWDLLVHDVDLAIQIFGGAEPARVRGMLGHFHPRSLTAAEDVAEAVMNFAGGGMATVSASRISQRKLRALTIAEVDRLIEVDLLRRDVTIYRHVALDAATPDGRGYRQQSIIEIPELTTSREPLAAQLDHFLDIVEGRSDAKTERARILPSHRAVAQVINDNYGPEEA